MPTINTAVLLLWAFVLIPCARSAKILGIFPVPARSHFILGSSLMKGLAEKGHDITFISPFAEKNPPKEGTYRDVILTGFWEEAEKRRNKDNMFENEGINPFICFFFANLKIIELTEMTLNHTNVQNLIHSKETFDVVIVEQFMNDALKVFATHFKAPLILFSTIGANAWINVLVGNPAPPSYVPALFTNYQSNQMSFLERTVNSLLFVFNECLNSVYVFPKHRQLARKYFPDNPDLYDILYNTSIVLVNSHESTNQAVPYVPQMIDIGGYHIQPPKKLPQDLQTFLDGAQDGVIYFSFGSNLKSSQLPPEKRDATLKTFSKLKEKVLWKWEEDVLPGQPPNVKLGKWLPQQDILAHPNVKLFLTHGGLLSTTEAIYNGVPILAVPIFGDQRLNAHNIVKMGYGLALNYKDITEDSLSQKLNQLLSDPTFSNNAKRKSVVFQDRLVKPMDTATYWVEYVIRHKNTEHLKVAALDLPWYRYFLLDVVLFLVVVICLVAYVVHKNIRAIGCYIRRKKSKVD